MFGYIKYIIKFFLTFFYYFSLFFTIFFSFSLFFLTTFNVTINFKLHLWACIVFLLEDGSRNTFLLLPWGHVLPGGRSLQENMKNYLAAFFSDGHSLAYVWGAGKASLRWKRRVGSSEKTFWVTGSPSSSIFASYGALPVILTLMLEGNPHVLIIHFLEGAPFTCKAKKLTEN